MSQTPHGLNLRLWSKQERRRRSKERREVRARDESHLRRPEVAAGSAAQGSPSQEAPQEGKRQ